MDRGHEQKRNEKSLDNLLTFGGVHETIHHRQDSKIYGRPGLGTIAKKKISVVYKL